MSFQEILLNSVDSIQSEGDLLGVIQNIINNRAGPRTDGKWSPCIDIVDTKDNLYVHIDIPGVTESSICIDFFNNKLSVSGDKIKTYNTPAIKNEIIYGKFTRCITLPMSVTRKDNVTVKYNNGVLTLIVDKQKEEQNKFSLSINSFSSSNKIENNKI